MAYQSILFVQKTPEEINQDADFLKDLNINQIIKATLGGKAEYKLESFFHMPLENTEDILYRQEIVKELENQELFQSFVQFGSKMRDIRSLNQPMCRPGRRKRRSKKSQYSWFTVYAFSWLQSHLGVKKHLPEKVWFQPDLILGASLSILILTHWDLRRKGRTVPMLSQSCANFLINNLLVFFSLLVFHHLICKVLQQKASSPFLNRAEVH